MLILLLLAAPLIMAAQDDTPVALCTEWVATVDDSQHIVLRWSPSPDPRATGYIISTGDTLRTYATVNGRTDTNEALFVSLLAPNERLQISGVEIRLRRLGRELNIPKVHPHKFRRTLATMAIDKGMPIEQVQHLLGHQSLDTTLQYAMVNQNNVKLSHHKFIG